MNRRQALLSRRVVRHCNKPSLVAIKEESSIPEDSPVVTMKPDRHSLIDLTEYPDHHSPRRPQRRRGRRGRPTPADSNGPTVTSEKYIDLTNHQDEATLDGGRTPNKAAANEIISVATLSPNAMMLNKRRCSTTSDSEPTLSPKLSYDYRHNKSPEPQREQRFETNNRDRSNKGGQDSREPMYSSHNHFDRRRAWRRLFIDTTAMEQTPKGETPDRNQDFLSAFSYEFKKRRDDTDDERSDIIVLDDILPPPPHTSRTTTPSAQLQVASPYHERFDTTTTTQEAGRSPTQVSTLSTVVPRHDLTHATQMHLLKQAERIEAIRQRAKELQQQRRMRPNPEWRPPEALVDFATQPLQGMKEEEDKKHSLQGMKEEEDEKQDNDGKYGWLSPTGRKALRFRKARKAADVVRDLKYAKPILEEPIAIEEVTRRDSKDAIIEVDSVVSDGSDHKDRMLKDKEETTGDVESEPAANGSLSVETRENKKGAPSPEEIMYTPLSPLSTKSLPLSASFAEKSPTSPSSTGSQPLSPHSVKSEPLQRDTTLTGQTTKSFRRNITVDTSMDHQEIHFISPESREMGSDHDERKSEFYYISPVSDTDTSRTDSFDQKSPNSAGKPGVVSPECSLEFNFSVSSPKEATMSVVEEKAEKSQTPENKANLSPREAEHTVEESRDPEHDPAENRSPTSRSEVSCEDREENFAMSEESELDNKDIDDESPSLPIGEKSTSSILDREDDELDLPLCLSESTRHGLDAIGADNEGVENAPLSPKSSNSFTPKDSPRSKTEDLQHDEQSYSSWSIKPKVSFPIGGDIFDKPFDEFSPRSDGNDPNSTPPGDEIDEIQEVDTNDLMTIMEEATSNIKYHENLPSSPGQESNRSIDQDHDFYPEEERQPPNRPSVVFHEETKSDGVPSATTTHDHVRRSRFTTPLLSPKSTKSTDTSTSGDNAIESDFYQVEAFRESFDSMEFAENNGYRHCAAPPLVYRLLDSTCTWLEGVHCFFCFQNPLFRGPKKRVKRSKVDGLGSSATIKRIARPSSPRAEGSVASRRRQQRARSSDERSKRSFRSTTRSLKERRSPRSRGDNHVHFSGNLTEQQHFNYTHVEMT